MRAFVFMFVVGIVACVAGDPDLSTNSLNCAVNPVENIQSLVDFKSLTKSCADKLKAQVNMELQAALTYMAMGAHFSEDSVNLPGFAKMFFESASEEREHAFKIVEYLLMRGLGQKGMEELIKKDLAPKAVAWESPLKALDAALALEITVTESITSIVKACENDKSDKLFSNDYHLVDYLTGVFLEEQLHGQRVLAGQISTLGKMAAEQGPLAEFLFDKKLLTGDAL